MSDDDLRQQIEAARAANDIKLGRGKKVEPPAKGMALGMRMATEFVVATFVGAAIGWGLDSLLHTKPWMLIFWLLCGFVAGVMNVVRVAQNSQDESGAQAPDQEV